MEEIKKILLRVRKNPETLPIKAKRFLRKKILYRMRGSLFEKYPYRISWKQFKRRLGVKNLQINETAFFLSSNIIDTRSVKDADAILRGEYEILGNKYTLEKINWHKDFSSGIVWKKKHFSRLTYDEEGSDKKIPWELSKFQHITTLGLAYLQTKEKKYVEIFKTQIEDWIQENPFEIGINWVTPMEAAIRSVNWINGYYFFKDALPETFWKEYMKQLYLHGKYIEENIEWSPQKENHYLSDMMGLFFLGIFFKHTPKGKQWISYAKKELEKEMLCQVSRDGVDYEGSLNYHRLVTELFLLAYINGTRNHISFSEECVKRIEDMCEFILWYTTPSGQAPSIGDTDNGRIISIWNKDVNDHRDILALAAALFRRGDFKTYGTFHNNLLLLINKEQYDAISERKVQLYPRAFTDYYIIRDEKIYLLIHCGDIGRNGFGGHSHNDQLSFVFSTKKKDYIIDPGTYTYTTDRAMRHLFRSTKYHNTLVVNNQEQNSIQKERPFDMDHKTYARCLVWDKEHFIGTHKGYGTLVSREILYNKKEKKITIIDKTTEDADVELNLHINKRVRIKKDKNSFILDGEVKIETEPAEILPSLFSSEYGRKEEAQKIQIKKHGKEIRTTITLME